MPLRTRLASGGQLARAHQVSFRLRESVSRKKSTAAQPRYGSQSATKHGFASRVGSAIAPVPSRDTEMPFRPNSVLPGIYSRACWPQTCLTRDVENVDMLGQLGIWGVARARALTVKKSQLSYAKSSTTTSNQTRARGSLLCRPRAGVPETC